MEELQINIQTVQDLEDDKKWCVYMHVNKINGKKYIGQTCQIPQRRWANGLGYIESTKFYNAIKKYGWDNFEHIVVQDNLTLNEANALEEDLIKKFQTTLDKNGYNLQSGGMNKCHSEETKKKMSDAQKGRIFTEESKKKMSIKRKGMYAGKDNPKARPIAQLTKELCFVQYWDYICQAANYFQISEACIRACCNGIQQTSAGYKWMYREDYEKWITENKDLLL